MKLGVGQFVRTKDGYISQYKYYDTTNMGKLLCIPLTDGTFANIEDIVKASYNIIDILEDGDYVNGELVTFIQSSNEAVSTDKHIRITNEDIKSVITHEQMEQMAYKVGK